MCFVVPGFAGDGLPTVSTRTCVPTKLGVIPLTKLLFLTTSIVHVPHEKDDAAAEQLQQLSRRIVMPDANLLYHNRHRKCNSEIAFTCWITNSRSTCEPAVAVIYTYHS